MEALKNVAFMGASTFVRLCFGMLTFVLLARLLGPNSFGVLMLWLSVATLLAMLPNFGFTPYLLREIGAAPESTQQIMGDVLSAKLGLSICALVIGLAGVAFVETSIFIVFFLLLCAQLIDSISEFFNIGFRATNRFGAETRIATIAAILQFSVIVAFVYQKPDLQTTALAYLLSRIVVLLLTWYAQHRYFNNLKPSSLNCALRCIRTTVAYAADFSLQSLFGQIDNLIINSFIGPFSVGIYQAGMKIFMAGAQAATVLSNVLLPHVASSLSDTSALQSKNNRMVVSFVFMGLCGLLFFLVVPKKLVTVVFGLNFEALGDILFPLGILFLIRFSAAGLGLVLTIHGMQRSRSICTLFHWILVAFCVAVFGIVELVDWIKWLVFGNLFLAASYLGIALTIGGFRPKLYCILMLGAVLLVVVGWLI